MPSDEKLEFMVEDARLIYRNFSGKENEYNNRGARNFCVVLDEETAQKMLRDGWNVKWPKPDEEGETGNPFIQCSVRFDVFPPRVVLITSRARTNLNEDTVEVLDWAAIETADLICRGHRWGDPNGKGGIKAYVKSLFVTIEEDYLERKYAINEPEE